jgi:phage-related protein (TIGR01555 family)
MIFDRLSNFLSGLGGDLDKNRANVFALSLISQEQLTTAYRGDWLTRKIIDIPAADATRAWRNWQAADDAIALIEAEERRLGIRQKVTAGLKRGRLYGGGAAILGYGDEPSRPAPTKIGKLGLQYVNIVTRYDLSVTDIDRDAASPNFGKPKMYRVNSQKSGQVDIHPSRVVRFEGADIPDMNLSVDGWGDPVMQAINDAITQAASINEHTAALFPEAKLDIIHVPRLSEHLSNEVAQARLTARFRYAAQMKSSLHMLLLESDGKEGEVWEQKQIDFAQYPEVIKTFLQIAAGAADIPVTRLLGQSPIGMNATGESDMRNYYDRISSDQEINLRPALSLLDEALIMSALGSRPADIYYEFAPLWQLTSAEKADIGLKKAQATQIYVNTGMVPTDALAVAVANQLVEDGIYPGLEQALEEAEKTIQEFVLENEESEKEMAELSAQAKIAGAKQPVAAAGAKQPVADAAPRTLYVRRDVVNASSIIAWAKAQGFETTLPAEELHVTIAYSRTPIDWMKVREDFGAIDRKGGMTISAGGPRIVEPLGDEGAVVLLFNSSWLAWRHITIKEVGASWDYPEYQPHITITYNKGSVDLSKVEPYRGEIILGPEIFEEVQEKRSIVEG